MDGRNKKVWLLTGFLICHLVLALAFIWANPLGEAPDEADHWAYVVYLAQEQSLPVGPQITQSKHPPFYHASAALFASLFARPSFDFLRANPDLRVPVPPEGPVNFFVHTELESWPLAGGALAFYAARLWSILFSLGTIVAAYGLIRAAFPGEDGLAMTVAGVLALLPTFAFIGSAVSNDGAVAFFSTAALWGGFAVYRAGGRMRAGWWTPFALGLGLLTKVSTVAVWPCVALLLAVPFIDRREWGRALRNLIAFFVPSGLIAAPWFWRNWQLYGDPLGLDLARQTIDQRLAPWTWADSWWLAKGWFLSFWGRFGAIGQIAQPVWMDWLLLLLTLVSLGGLANLWRQKKADGFRLGVVILLLAVIGVAGVMWRYSLIALGTDQGRLLYPALGALVGLWVLGLRVLGLRAIPASLSHVMSRLAGVVLVSATGLWSVAILVGVIVPAYAAAPVLVSSTPATEAAPVDFGEIQLIAADLAAEPTLYWTAPQQPSQDWRTVVRVTADDGTLVWDWQRSPGQGRYATDRWQAGEIVLDSYPIRWPDWAGAGRYRVEVGVRQFDGDWALPVNPTAQAATAEHPFVEIGWIEYRR